MKPMTSSNKLIWAVDPLSVELKNRKVIEKFLKTLQKNLKLKILPLSVLTPDDLHFSFELMAPWGEKLKELGEIVVKPAFRKMDLQQLLKPEVLTSSKHRAIDDFVKVCVKEKASLIAVMTHEKKGVEKNRIGRFAQKLIERSLVPVVCLRPSTSVPKKISKILFPTDFSPASYEAYKFLLNFARPFKAKVVLYHNLYEPVLPAAEFTGVPIASAEVLQNYADEFTSLQRNRAHKWIRAAHKQGVTTMYHSERGDFSLAKSILQAARHEQCDMIALGIESHPVLRTLVGSAVRDVIASSSQPVLVINSSK